MLLLIGHPLHAEGIAVWYIDYENCYPISLYGDVSRLSTNQAAAWRDHLHAAMPAKLGFVINPSKIGSPDSCSRKVWRAIISHNLDFRVIEVAFDADIPDVKREEAERLLDRVCSTIGLLYAGFQPVASAAITELPPRPPKPKKLDIEEDTWLTSSRIGRWFFRAYQWLAAG